MHRQPARRAESGMAGVAFVVAAALALVVFVTLADLVTMQFTRSAVRAAVDEGVRAGSRSDAPVAVCEQRARAVLDGLLGASTRDDVQLGCTAGAASSALHAQARAVLVPWLPGLPPWTVTVEGDAQIEALP